ncbi:hypothetical protein BH739_16360 [Enterococcus casseliflavus]|nr:hypothetical protein BH739_16360 [Enterococcus casseliflavus]
MSLVKGTSILRKTNELRILKLLRTNQAETRQDIAKLTGLGKNTVSVIIDSFLNDGIVEEVGSVNDLTVGRPKRIISLIPSALKTIAIKIDRTKIRFFLFDYTNTEIENKTLENINSSDINEVSKVLKEEITRFDKDNSGIVGVGVTLTGIINSDEGVVIKSTPLNWENVNLKRIIGEFFDGNIYILSNVRALGLINPYTKDEESIYYIRIRRGIGGALIVNSQINFGKTWVAGEIGRIPISFENNLKLEQVLNEKQVLWELENVESKESVYKEKSEILGLLVENLIYILNPGVIVLDSVYCDNDTFLNFLKGYLERNIDSSLLNETNIITMYGGQEEHPEKGVSLLVINQFEKINLER